MSYTPWVTTRLQTTIGSYTYQNFFIYRKLPSYLNIRCLCKLIIGLKPDIWCMPIINVRKRFEIARV